MNFEYTFHLHFSLKTVKALLKKVITIFLSLNVFDNNILQCKIHKYFMQNDNNKMSKCLIKFVLTHTDSSAMLNGQDTRP